MIDRAVGEAVADREAGMAGPDDDSGGAFDGPPRCGCALRCYTTSTVTFTGLVMTS